MGTWYTAAPPFSKYEVSTDGQIRNRKGYVLLGSTGIGYVRVGLVSDTGGFSTVLLHRLITQTFCGPPCQGDVAHHINGNTLDNRSSNLIWASRKENAKKRSPPKSRKSRPVLQMDLSGKVIHRWPIMKDVPFNHSMIWRACRGKVRKAYGYLWAYEDLQPRTGETWKTLFSGSKRSEVSDQGRVRLASGKISLGVKTPSGYRLTSFGEHSTVVHRLVAMAFLPDPPGPLENYTVNHKNFNKGDNRASNLEWVTQADNNLHAQQVRKAARVFRRPVFQHLSDGTREKFTSLAEASRKTGVRRSLICITCQGKIETAGGFKWSYADLPTDG